MSVVLVLQYCVVLVPGTLVVPPQFMSKYEIHAHYAYGTMYVIWVVRVPSTPTYCTTSSHSYALPSSSVKGRMIPVTFTQVLNSEA